MGLWDHTALALVIIIDINSGERSWTLVICRPFQRQPWALSIRGASLSSPLLELMLWRLQGRTASLMRVLAQQTCHSNTALLFLRHAQWLTPPNINVSCLLSLSPSFLPSLSRHICSQDILSPFIFRFASHFCHGKAVIESLLVHIIAFSPSRPVSLSELTLISVCCPTSSFWSLSPLHPDFTFTLFCLLVLSPGPCWFLSILATDTFISHHHCAVCHPQLTADSSAAFGGWGLSKSTYISLLHFLPLITSSDGKEVHR